MTNFLLDNEGFESKIVDFPDNLSRLQISKLDDDNYSVIKLIDQSSYLIGTFTKEELRLLCDTLDDTPRHLDYAYSVIHGICEYYKISFVDLVNKTRGTDYVRRRKLTMYILYKFTYTPLTKIRNILKFKTHANIIHHIKTVEGLLSNESFKDLTYKYEYKELLNYLKLQENDKKTTKTNGH